MKTVMIIDKNKRFSNRLKYSIHGENIDIITADTNRDALQHLKEGKEIDLFVIPTSRLESKEYFVCKSTESLSSPLCVKNELLSENNSPNELKTFLKNHLK